MFIGSSVEDNRGPILAEDLVQQSLVLYLPQYGDQPGKMVFMQQLHVYAIEILFPGIQENEEPGRKGEYLTTEFRAD